MTGRTLVLLRHAKTEATAAHGDADRSLTDRGHADATAAGGWLAQKAYIPDLVLCSTARRARQTWHAIAVALAQGPAVRYEPDIYHGGPDELLGVVRVSDDANVVLLIGHNPSLSMLSALLDPVAAADSDGLRTSGIAVHHAKAPWADWASAPVVETTTARG